MRCCSKSRRRENITVIRTNGNLASSVELYPPARPASATSQSARAKQKMKTHYCRQRNYEDDKENDEGSLYYDSAAEVYVERRPQKRYKEVFSSKVKPNSPLSLELEKAEWPPMFKLPASLLKYDGKSDPRQFLWKYTMAISSGGGDDVAMARAMIMALKGSTQQVCLAAKRKHKIMGTTSAKNREQLSGVSTSRSHIRRSSPHKH
jgi:hypothetical protein